MGPEERDRESDEVLIGGRERREITIVEYDVSWPARFAAEHARIRSALSSSDNWPGEPGLT